LIVLAIMVASSWTATPSSALTHDQREVRHLIREAFPHHYQEAWRVSWCESRWDRHATNGQYRGVFQLSTSWRGYFKGLHPGWHDVAYTPRQNIQAAHAIFRGGGWSAWECQP
jgi:hypothetical protein